MGFYNENNINNILHDLKKDGGKEVLWRVKRLITLRLAQAYKRIGSKKYKKILDCGGYLEFKRFSDNSMKLKTAYFCKIRLCPMCNWRRSKMIFANVSKIMGNISENYSFIFLTLTCKNVENINLKRQIDNLFSAYKKLSQLKRFEKAVRGYVRCFEITHNWKTHEYHPHFHCILAVDKSYFTTDLYICQDDWCLMWQSCLTVDYKPIVDVRVFTESEKGKGKEVAEVAKYTIKSSNIMANLKEINIYSKNIQDEVRSLTDSLTDEIVLTLDSALANRRLMGYGGVFKQKHKELNLKDIDDDLVHTEVDSKQNILNYEIECYRWDIKLKNYVRYKKGGSDDE